MDGPWEDLIWNENATAEDLARALDRRNAEIARVLAGIEDGSIVLEPMNDDDGY